MQPLISIIIPVHNHGAYLSEAVASVIEQNMALDYEIVIIDDGSTDHTPTITKLLSRENIKCWRTENRGASAARNLGTQKAQGRYLLYLDSDNTLQPNFFAKTLPLLEDDIADVVYGRFTVFGEYKETMPYSAFNRRLVTLQDLAMGNNVDTCCLVRANILPPNPWNTNLKRHEDWDFHLNNLKNGLRYAFVDEDIFNYRASSQADTANNILRANDAAKIINTQQHLADLRSTDVTIGVMMSGRRYCTTDCLNALAKLEHPSSKMNLLLYDNSNDESFLKDVLIPFVNANRTRFNGINIYTEHLPNFDYNLEQHLAHNYYYQKFDNIAHKMNKIASITNTPYLLFVDDDTLIPPNTLDKLFSSINSHPKTVAAQGVLRGRENKYGIIDWDFADINRPNLYTTASNAGDMLTGMGGTYCLLIETSWLKHNPVTLKWLNGKLSGPDQALCYDIWHDKQSFITNWDVKCEHIHPMPNGLTVSLHPDDYREPAHYFVQPHFPLIDYSIKPLLNNQALPPINRKQK